MKKILGIALFCFSVISAKPADQRNNRCSSDPYISGDSFRAIADHVYDETDRDLKPNEVLNKQIIFVKTDYLEDFFSKIHPNIQGKYILITHNSDYGAPGIYEQYLKDEKIIAWFGQNPTIQATEKFIPIPIGLANQCWSHGNVSTFRQSVQKISTLSKNVILGINFRPSTNGAARNYPYQYFSAKSFCTHIFDDNLEQYLLKMAQAKFIISPFGNGLDCHRTWEALLMGTIPVSLHSHLDSMFIDLPVIVVDAWEEVDENFLNKKYQEYQEIEWDMSKTYFVYWKKLIYSYQIERGR